MIANGNFNEKLLNHYAEGQSVSFTCNSDYVEDPSNGLVECEKDFFFLILCFQVLTKGQIYNTSVN